MVSRGKPIASGVPFRYTVLDVCSCSTSTVLPEGAAFMNSLYIDSLTGMPNLFGLMDINLNEAFGI